MSRFTAGIQNSGMTELIRVEKLVAGIAESRFGVQMIPNNILEKLEQAAAGGHVAEFMRGADALWHCLSEQVPEFDEAIVRKELKEAHAPGWPISQCLDWAIVGARWQHALTSAQVAAALVDRAECVNRLVTQLKYNADLEKQLAEIGDVARREKLLTYYGLEQERDRFRLELAESRANQHPWAALQERDRFRVALEQIAALPGSAYERWNIIARMALGSGNKTEGV